MSLTTWKAEFYPIAASECPKEDAIAHSLRKWKGLRREATMRHELRTGVRSIADEYDFMTVGSESCALCAHFFDDESDGSPCGACPLAQSRDGFPCDRETASESRAPWDLWTHENDPEPMIAALEKAAKKRKS